jgi:hypothetical protein
VNFGRQFLNSRYEPLLLCQGRERDFCLLKLTWMQALSADISARALVANALPVCRDFEKVIEKRLVNSLVV